MATEREERETAARIAATFYSGRDGIGPERLFKLAEQVRDYIRHGDHSLTTKAARRTAR